MSTRTLFLTAGSAAILLSLGVAGYSPVAGAQTNITDFMREFGQAREALDAEYREGKNDCFRQFSMKGAPERDSTKYRYCINDLGERHNRRTCDFYVEWYERSEESFGLTQPENYPKCAQYY